MDFFFYLDLVYIIDADFLTHLAFDLLYNHPKQKVCVLHWKHKHSNDHVH